MHPLLLDLATELLVIESQLQQTIPDLVPISTATNHWGIAGITRHDLTTRINALVEKIKTAGSDELGPDTENIGQHLTALQFARANTIPQMVSANGVSAIPAFTITLDALERALAPHIEKDKGLALDNSKALRKAATQIRGMESRLRDLAPKTASVQSMVERIERAYEAADQLPADLEILNEARQRIDAISVDAEKDRGQIVAAKEAADAAKADLQVIKDEAAAILAQCESVYSSATSVGLAASFDERSKNLGKSMWFWVFGLVSALVVGGAVGTSQLKSLSGLLSQPGASGALISLNIALSILSVGAPVWFAWLATKQVGQRFRISEDYAFKAAVSRAYEGYRRETVKIDPELQVQLLRSALQRLDEQPLRLVEPASYGSPWHELMASDLIKDAFKSVPGFAESLSKLARDSLDGIKAKKAPTVAANSEIKPVAEDPEKSAS